MLINKFLAYGPERHPVETVMRMHSVKRWHMIDTTRQQTLAEHSANVGLLAMMVARTAPINFFDPYTIVGAVALCHDIEEAFTGDIPTHTKRYLTGLDALEEEVRHRVFTVPCNVNTAMLVKICDLADGIRFIRLHGVDMTAAHAQEGLEDQLIAKMDSAAESLQWPKHLVDHVRGEIMFYAYENH